MVPAAVVAAPAAVEPSAAGQPPDSIGIQLLDVPVKRASDPRARLYIVDHVPAGAAFTRRVKVTNTTSAVQHVELYPGPATISDGVFGFAAEHSANELTKWISLERKVVRLGPGRSATVRATVRVPARASEGERYGVIWASVSTGQPDGSAGILVNRVGVRVYLGVGPGGDPVTDFQIEQVIGRRSDDGLPAVAALVHNVGKRAIDVGGTLGLSDGPGAARSGPYLIPPNTTLAPGDRRWIQVGVEHTLADGPWTVQLLLVSGEVERTFTGVVAFPAPGAAPVQVRPQSPLTNLLLLLVFCTVVASFVVLRRFVVYRRFA